MKRISAVVSVICAVLGSGAILLSGVRTGSGIEQWQPLNGRVESVLNAKAGETTKLAAAKEEKPKQEQVSKQDVKPDVRQDSAKTGSAQPVKEKGGVEAAAENAQSPGMAAAPGQAASRGNADSAEQAGNAASGQAVTPSQQAAAGSLAGGQSAADGQVKKINVNTAGLSELTDLPGIGEAKAKAILEYRDQHGPFKSVADLDKVKGIGPKMLEKMKPYIEL